jgi:hypothetical protein
LGFDLLFPDKNPRAILFSTAIIFWCTGKATEREIQFSLEIQAYPAIGDQGHH